MTIKSGKEAMKPRSFVGFVAQFPSEYTETRPPGQELALSLNRMMKAAGFDCSSVTEREGWAWEFLTTRDYLEIETIVGLVDDVVLTPPRQWLITNICRRSLLRCLFGGGKSQQERDNFLRTFCEELHRQISQDDRFHHIVWHYEDGFDTEKDDPAERS